VNAQKKQLLIVGVLGVLLVGVLGYQMTRPNPGLPSNLDEKVDMTGTKQPSGPTPAAKPAVGAPKKPTAASAQKEPVDEDEVNFNLLLMNIEEIDFIYENEKKARDVMEPLLGVSGSPGTSEPGTSDPLSEKRITIIKLMQQVVSGIMWDPIRPLAVVDDEVVYPGYEYKYGNDIVVVEAIEKDFVAFRFEDALIQVHLKEQ